MAKRYKRVFLIVLDSFGIGEMPDADRFGDKGANTLKSIAKSSQFSVPNLAKLGLFNIDGVSCMPPVGHPSAAFCRLEELSKGKDTTIGHWEIAGLVSENPLPTYPHGFPDEIIDEFVRQTGRGVLANIPMSGTEAIKEYGDEHVKTGKLIVYTSADSVFQIAAHEDIIPPEELYRYCRIARAILTGKHGVGRVIARPFEGTSGSYKRTARRHDFSIEPPKSTLLDCLKENGLDVIAVGKIYDIFAGRGITKHCYTESNDDGMRKTEAYLEEEFNGLCFLNLVEFDMLYGHRNDIDGYAAALTRFDGWLGGFMDKLGQGDLLMIAADHGCDPGYIQSTDHSREYVPLLVYGSGVSPVNLGTRKGFCDIAATIVENFDIQNGGLDGVSFLKEL
jgi:phosphopentomutase